MHQINNDIGYLITLNYNLWICATNKGEWINEITEKNNLLYSGILINKYEQWNTN